LGSNNIDTISFSASVLVAAEEGAFADAVVKKFYSSAASFLADVSPMNGMAQIHTLISVDSSYGMPVTREFFPQQLDMLDGSYFVYNRLESFDVDAFQSTTQQDLASRFTAQNTYMNYIPCEDSISAKNFINSPPSATPQVFLDTTVCRHCDEPRDLFNVVVRSCSTYDISSGRPTGCDPAVRDKNFSKDSFGRVLHPCRY